jgi:amino acid permease
MHSYLSRPTRLLRKLLRTCPNEVLLRPLNCSSYIAFPIFGLFFIGWRYYDGCSTIPLDRVDLVSGKEEEEHHLDEQRAKEPKSQWRRLWDAL